MIARLIARLKMREIRYFHFKASYMYRHVKLRAKPC